MVPCRTTRPVHVALLRSAQLSKCSIMSDFERLFKWAEWSKSTVHVCVRGYWQWHNANGYIGAIGAILSHQCHAVQWVTGMTLPYFSTSPASLRARFTFNVKLAGEVLKKAIVSMTLTATPSGLLRSGLRTRLSFELRLLTTFSSEELYYFFWGIGLRLRESYRLPSVRGKIRWIDERYTQHKYNYT